VNKTSVDGTACVSSAYKLPLIMTPVKSPRCLQLASLLILHWLYFWVVLFESHIFARQQIRQ
jgi:hypothetical protein